MTYLFIFIDNIGMFTKIKNLLFKVNSKSVVVLSHLNSNFDNVGPFTSLDRGNIYKVCYENIFWSSLSDHWWGTLVNIICQRTIFRKSRDVLKCLVNKLIEAGTGSLNNTTVYEQLYCLIVNDVHKVSLG